MPVDAVGSYAAPSIEVSADALGEQQLQPHRQALVSVVIPTYRRVGLVGRAVRSALAQTYQRLEVVVVIDGVDDGTRAVVEALGDPRARVIERGVTEGAAAARNTGVQAAAGLYIATLDDDDEWTPDKIERQMQVVEQCGLAGSEFIISCRTECRDKNSVSVLPQRLYCPELDLGEYLFYRRSPLSRSGLIPSGTYLFPRALVQRVAFPHDDAHEELGWLLLCTARDKVMLIMMPEPMFIYHMRPSTRNSTQSWRASVDFARKYRNLMSRAAFNGLLSSTTAWRAKRQDGLAAVLEIAWVMATEGRCRNLAQWLSVISIALVPLNSLDIYRARRPA